eukprot:4784029-Alexandrium_andersonii.AAC.1
MKTTALLHKHPFLSRERTALGASPGGLPPPRTGASSLSVGGYRPPRTPPDWRLRCAGGASR